MQAVRCDVEGAALVECGALVAIESVMVDLAIMGSQPWLGRQAVGARGNSYHSKLQGMHCALRHHSIGAKALS